MLFISKRYDSKTNNQHSPLLFAGKIKCLICRHVNLARDRDAKICLDCTLIACKLQYLVNKFYIGVVVRRKK